MGNELPNCKSQYGLYRDAAGKLYRTADGKLISNVVCYKDLKVIVSGWTGACADMNGEYIVPLEDPNICGYDSTNPGGSVPPTWNGFMLVFRHTFDRPYYWEMRIVYFPGGTYGRSGLAPSVQLCPIGSWTLDGGSLAPYFCAGQPGVATSEWNE